MYIVTDIVIAIVSAIVTVIFIDIAVITVIVIDIYSAIFNVIVFFDICSAM